MVTAREVTQQLSDLGVRIPFWIRPEARELRHVLSPGEKIEHCVFGKHDGGFAMLCTTSFRILLIDKKPFFLFLEDIRYDMVTEVDYTHRLLDATLKVLTPNKTLTFTSYRRLEIKAMTLAIQQQVLMFRQAGMQPQQQPITPLTAIVSDDYDEDALNTQSPGMSNPGLPQISLPSSANPYIEAPLALRRRASRFQNPD